MNIMPLSFKGTLFIQSGKSTSTKTAHNFDNVIKKLEYSRNLAVKAQRYMESYSTRRKIDALPSKDTVEFRNLRIYNEKVDVRELEAQSPQMIYTNCSEYELFMQKEDCGQVRDFFKFKLDKNGNLNSEEADAWLDSKLNIIA